MKVLHFCSFYKPLGGGEKLLFSVLDIMEENGVENVIIAPEAQSNGPTGLRKEYFLDYLEYPFTRSSFFSSIWNNRKLMRAITAILNSERPDVIHLHNQQNPFIYLACLKSGIPMVRNIHDPRLYCPTNWRLLPDNSLCPNAFGRACISEGCIKPRSEDLKQFFVTMFNRQLSFRNTTLIIESQESYQMALQNGYREDQLSLIPNCTSLPPLEKELQDKQHNNKPGENSILFVGRASYEKGLHFLVNALPKLRNDFKLYILTAGDYYNQKIAPLVEKLNLESQVEVRFNTSYQDTARFYSMADLVVVPSIWFETFCLIGIEAYSHATPVVATRTGGIKDWCKDGETGYLVDIFDEDALASRIDQLLDDPEKAKQFGLNGYQRVQEHYSEDIYYRRLRALYEKVIQDGQSDTNRFFGMARRSVQSGPGLPELFVETRRASGSGPRP
jgi:glycosyltransferase involved in cell wall biosynthesis